VLPSSGFRRRDGEIKRLILYSMDNNTQYIRCRAPFLGLRIRRLCRLKAPPKNRAVREEHPDPKNGVACRKAGEVARPGKDAGNGGVGSSAAVGADHEVISS
jgi:hypothetical protein